MMKRIRIALFAGFLVACFGAQAQVVMRGDVNFWTYGSRLRVEVDDITNFGDQTTEKLRFIVWASEDPWEDYDRGRILGLVALPRIGANRNWDNARRTMRLYRPSTGWYYVTVTLAERTVDEDGKVRWEIRDKAELGLHYFSRSSLPGFPF